MQGQETEQDKNGWSVIPDILVDLSLEGLAAAFKFIIHLFESVFEFIAELIQGIG